jgi:hypothetical protein
MDEEERRSSPIRSLPLRGHCDHVGPSTTWALLMLTNHAGQAREHLFFIRDESWR